MALRVRRHRDRQPKWITMPRSRLTDDAHKHSLNRCGEGVYYVRKQLGESELVGSNPGHPNRSLRRVWEARVAELLRIPDRKLERFETGSPIPAEVILVLMEVTGVNPRWLDSGEGERYRRRENIRQQGCYRR